MAEGESLVVCLVHDAFGSDGGEEAVLTRGEGWVGSWCTAFRAVIVIVVSGEKVSKRDDPQTIRLWMDVLDNVFERLDISVSQFGKVAFDIVVKVDLWYN